MLNNSMSVERIFAFTQWLYLPIHLFVLIGGERMRRGKLEIDFDMFSNHCKANCFSIRTLPMKSQSCIWASDCQFWACIWPPSCCISSNAELIETSQCLLTLKHELLKVICTNNNVRSKTVPPTISNPKLTVLLCCCCVEKESIEKLSHWYILRRDDLETRNLFRITLHSTNLANTRKSRIKHSTLIGGLSPSTHQNLSKTFPSSSPPNSTSLATLSKFFCCIVRRNFCKMIAEGVWVEIDFFEKQRCNL